MNHHLHHLLRVHHPLAWALLATAVAVLIAGAVLFWYNGEIAVAPEEVPTQEEEQNGGSLLRG